MGIEYMKTNASAQRMWIEHSQNNAEAYYREHPDSLVPNFEKELRDMGFCFDISNQTLGFMPKHKQTVLPLAIKYYKLAKCLKKTNEQNHFMSFFNFKVCEEVIPMLIEDYYDVLTEDITRWFISDCLYQIRSKQYVDEYLRIIENPEFGNNRQMIILLVGKLKVDNAIPILINLLEDEGVRMHAISALGDFKREELRQHFVRFVESKHSGWRKYAKAALKKLEG